MDAASLLAPVAAPVADPTAAVGTTTPVAAPGGAFADVFAQMMEGVAPVLPGADATAPIVAVPGTPTIPTGATVPVLAVEPTGPSKAIEPFSSGTEPLVPASSGETSKSVPGAPGAKPDLPRPTEAVGVEILPVVPPLLPPPAASIPKSVPPCSDTAEPTPEETPREATAVSDAFPTVLPATTPVPPPMVAPMPVPSAIPVTVATTEASSTGIPAIAGVSAASDASPTDVPSVSGDAPVVLGDAKPSPADRAPVAPFAAQDLPPAPELGAVPQVVPPATAPAEPEGAPLKIANAAVAGRVGATTATDALKVATEAANVAKAEAPSAVALEGAVRERKDDGEAASDDAPPHAPPQTLGAVATKETVATARPEAGADRPEVDRHLVVRQVADRIENMVAARPRDGVTIHLEPHDLGTVTLVVKGLASALDVQVSASDERVQKSLDASRPELAQALAPRGIELREIRVVASAPSSGTSADAGAGSNPDGRPRGQAPTPQTPQGFRTTTSSSGAKRARAVRAMGQGVDVLV